MPLPRAASFDPRGSLRRPVSESGRLCRGEGGHARGGRRRRGFVLSMLSAHAYKNNFQFAGFFEERGFTGRFQPVK